MERTGVRFALFVSLALLAGAGAHPGGAERKPAPVPTRRSALAAAHPAPTAGAPGARNPQAGTPASAPRVGRRNPLSPAFDVLLRLPAGDPSPETPLLVEAREPFGEPVAHAEVRWSVDVRDSEDSSTLNPGMWAAASGRALTDAAGRACFPSAPRGVGAGEAVVYHVAVVDRLGRAAEAGLTLPGRSPAAQTPVRALDLVLHAPEVMSAGDVGLVRAEVQNGSAAPQSFTLRWRAPGLEPLSALALPGRVEPGASAWLDLPVRARSAGIGSVEAGLGEGDRSRLQEIRVEPVPLPGPGRGLRTLTRIAPGPAGPEILPWDGALGPGEELEVRLRVPAETKERVRALRDPIPGGLALVAASEPEGAILAARETGGPGTRGYPRAGGVAGVRFDLSGRSLPETLTYRLRARSPGSWTFGPTEVLVGNTWKRFGAPEPVRVVPLPAPRLESAALQKGRLEFRCVLAKPFRGALDARLVVRTLDGDGMEIARADVPAPFGPAPDRERTMALSLPAAAPEKVASAVVEARLEGSGAEWLGGATVPLPKVAARSRYALPAVLGQPELRVLGQNELVRGSRATFRVLTLNSRGRVPVPGTAVRVRFQPEAPDGKGSPGPAVPLLEGTTDAGGSLEGAFTVPETLRGRGKLLVTSRSELGERQVALDVRIEDRLQMLLSTDKPVYQPGQTIHLRSLSLRKPDLQPLADAPVTLEVTDPKGNKVFKQRGRTSAFGVAAADFTLADEIHLGRYVLRVVAQPEGGPELSVEKTLEVQKYVLPKFKIEVATERPFYLPGERLKGTLQVRYFFGKPVAGGEVELKLSTFVAQWEPIGTIKGKTTVDGEFTFEQDLPKHFVGQPLQAGNAVLRLEAAVTDGAQHPETRTHTLTVSANPIKVAVIPESGRLALGLENRVYVVATYPDGKPASGARARVSGPGLPAQGLELTADEHGIAGFRLVPETAPGRVRLQVEVRDPQGRQAREDVVLLPGSAREALLLRTDRAVYEVGQVAKLDVLSTGARGTVYVDVVRNRQTVLTRSLSLANGRASTTVPLDAETAGTLEFRAYRILPDGEVTRDTRIAYVNPANELQIQVSSDQETYRPGSPASLRLRVTDRDGHPVMAALGVNIVDESVFALQELQPGLERVYFLLEKELLEPHYQIKWSYGSAAPVVDRRERASADRDGIARVLFAAVEMAHEYSLSASTGGDPAATAKAEATKRVEAISGAIRSGVWTARRNAYYRHHGELPETREGLQYYAPLFGSGAPAADPWGQPYVLRAGPESPNGSVPLQVASPGPDAELGTADDVVAEAELDLPDWLPERTFRARTLAPDPWGRLPESHWAYQAINSLRARDGFTALPVFTRPYTRYDMAVILHRAMRDLQAVVASITRQNRFDTYDRVYRRLGWLIQSILTRECLNYRAPGEHPSGRGGPDAPFVDVPETHWAYSAVNSMAAKGILTGQPGERFRGTDRATPAEWAVALQRFYADCQRQFQEVGMRSTARAADRGVPGPRGPAGPPGPPGIPSAAAAPVRVREYFPETLYANPALVTDADGRAQIDLETADSITTWRLTALANSRAGQLGSVTAPIRVFQDFFVDLDLPVALTQNDEVQVPVAVYNYLPAAQKVRLRLQLGDEDKEAGPAWFELVGGDAAEKTVELQKDQVSVVHFRVKARKPGVHRFTVFAQGSQLSDAVRRSVDVKPDGREVQVGASDRLEKAAVAAVTLPSNAIPGSEKLLVKLYPGVFSQVVEGLEALFRLPYG